VNINISVVVPVYNVAPFLPACMDSLINQTLKNIEIIAVNDASTDNSLEILQRYAKMDKRIKVINFPENRRTAAARNAGLNSATGVYIGLLDGDDYLDLDFYEKLYELAREAQSPIAKGLTKIHEGPESSILGGNDGIRENKFNFHGQLLSAIYSRKMLKKYNIRFHIDFFCFQIQAVYYANKIACRDDVFYNYVRRLNSCDSDIFSLEKWERLNLGHGNFIYDWLKSHEYTPEIRQLYLDRIKGLYFYGYNKLAKADILPGAKILTDTILQHCNCGYNTAYPQKIKRKIVKQHPKVKRWRYIYNRIKGDI
jgi:glycosyltransferase involved in cell wall biosynthesis